MSIGDLITLPRIRTVVQLADLEDPNLRRLLAESFVLTRQVASALDSILALILGEGGSGGTGTFLHGHFGAGKSHFLLVLHLLARGEFGEEILAELRSDPSLRPGYRELEARARALADAHFLVVPVSLVHHSAREHLEEIVLSRVAAALPEARGELLVVPEDFHHDLELLLLQRYREPFTRFAEAHGFPATGDGVRAILGVPGLLETLLAEIDFPYRPRFSRTAFFERLEGVLGRYGHGGLLLLIDELSEYLRSKSDRRAFNEEIRFLQFLGEYGAHHPLRVVATLQERIEETGEIAQTSFHKIKDRFPLRRFLTVEHIEEVIARRLVQKRPGAEKRLRVIYREMKEAFPGLSVGRDRFIALYPLHPMTLTLLDRLKPLFSQQRGIVDFVHHQLAGDPKRGIRGILDADDHTLVTPDTIFDHFRDRIRDRVEMRPYVDVVYAYFEQEIERIVAPQREMAPLALRLLKILILLEISPVAHRYRVRELAQMLLYRVTDLEAGVNYHYIHDILMRLYRHGAYLVRERALDDPLDDHFRIDLSADLALVARRRVEEVLSTIFPEDTRIFGELAPRVDLPHLPLGTWIEQGSVRRTIRWQNTPREGLVRLCDPASLDEEARKTLERELAETELDFALLVFPPLPEGAREEIRRRRRILEEVLLPTFRDLPVAFWNPASLPETLRRIVAQIVALRKIEAEGGEDTLESALVAYLTKEIAAARKVIEGAFTKAYHDGRILYHAEGGEVAERDPRSVGLLPFDAFLQEIATTLLNVRYPKHALICPYTGFPPPAVLSDLIEHFLRPGEVTFERSSALKRRIDDLFVPLNLVRKRGGRYLLSVDPKRSPIVAEVIAWGEAHGGEGAAPLPTAELYRHLRKGPYGLGRTHFELLLCALLLSGTLTGYTNGRPRPIDQIDFFNIGRIEEVALPPTIPREALLRLEATGIVSPDLLRGENPSLHQKGIWAQLESAAERLESWIGQVEGACRKIPASSHLARVVPERVAEAAAALLPLTEVVRRAETPGEGILAFLQVWETLPPDALPTFERLFTFLATPSGGLDRFLYIEHYLTDPRLVVPQEGPPVYRELREKLTALHEWLESAAQRLEEAGAIEELEGAFRDFLAGYMARYAEEHRRQVARERFTPLRALRNSQAYRTLARLSEIEVLSVKNDRVKVDRQIGAILERACDAFHTERLRSTPVCTCGFTLGELPLFPPRSVVMETIERGIREYLRELQAPAHAVTLQGFVRTLEQVGRGETASRIAALLALDPTSSGFLERSAELVSPDVIGAINEAFGGRTILVTRNLDELYENIVDRTFPRQRLREIFEEWLGDAKEGETHVRVVSNRRSPSDPATEVRRGATERFPELLPLLDHLGDDDFLLLLFLSRWLLDHDRPCDLLEGFFPFPDPSSRDLWREVAATLPALADFLLSRPTGVEIVERVEGMIVDRGFDRRLFELAVVPHDPASLFALFARERLFSFATHLAVGQIVKILLLALGGGIDPARGSHPGPPRSFTRRQIEEIRRARRGEEERRLRKGAACDLLEAFLFLGETLPAFHTPPPASSEAWATFYIEAMATQELVVERIEELNQRLGVVDIERFRIFAAKFRRLRQRRIEAFEADADRLLGEASFRPHDVPGRIERYIRKLSPKRVHGFLLDGMRWDTWVFLEEAYLPRLEGTYRLIEKIPLWAAYPTVTWVEIAALLEGRSEGGKRIELRYPETFEEALAPANPGTIPVTKFDELDRKLHHTTEGLSTLYRETLLQLDATLTPLLEGVEPRTLFFFFSDHGFFRFPGRKARYRHGGKTPFEIITPFVILLKVA